LFEGYKGHAGQSICRTIGNTDVRSKKTNFKNNTMKKKDFNNLEHRLINGSLAKNNPILLIDLANLIQESSGLLFKNDKFRKVKIYQVARIYKLARIAIKIIKLLIKIF
jgi:hypothetical protein